MIRAGVRYVSEQAHTKNTRGSAVIVSVLLFVCSALVAASTSAAAWALADSVRNNNHPSTWVPVIVEIVAGVVSLILLLIAMKAVNSRYDCLSRKLWTRGSYGARLADFQGHCRSPVVFHQSGPVRRQGDAATPLKALVNRDDIPSTAAASQRL